MTDLISPVLFRFKTLLTGLLLLAPLSTAAQVMIAPTLIYMDETEPYGTFMVINRSDVPQEVSLSFEFGYPTSDADGTRMFVFGDSLAQATYGLGEWIRAFPRQFILGQGKRQTVRLMVRTPATLRDGVYWTRLVTKATEAAPEMPAVADVSEAHVNLALRQLIPVLFRRGNPSPALQLKDLRADVGAGVVRIFADLQRNGDAPFVGTAIVRIYDAEGRMVMTKKEQTEVYFTYTERIDLRRGDLPPGAYQVQVTFESQLRDIPSHRLPKMKSITAQTSFELADE